MKNRIIKFIRLLAVMWAVLILPAFNSTAATLSLEPGSETIKPGNEGPECCAYSIHFVNLYNSPYIKKIRVSAICDTKICCAESDEWSQTNNYPQSVDWSPEDGSAVPPGNAIDNEFLIFLDNQSSPHYLQVDWFDMNNNIVCQHQIEIYCNKDYKEDEDWTQYTHTTSLNDPNLFVMAVREEEEDQEGCDPNGSFKVVDCEVSTIIACLGTNTYLVTLFGPSSFDTYTWLVSGPAAATLSSIQSPTMSLTTPGTYSVSLMSINTSSKDTCLKTINVIIPSFNPSFTTAVVPILCGTNLEFTAQGIDDPSTVSSISWVCTGHPGFPNSGNPVSYDFLGAGTYSVTMTIMDIFGCAHSVTQNVTIDPHCQAAVKVEKYFLCPDCHGSDNVMVTFKNLSTGGKCPLTFKWDFGDGQTATSNESLIYQTHPYLITNCQLGQTFTLKLTMTDNSTPTPCTSYASIPVVIEPCHADFDTIICPNGDVICEGNMWGEFVFPPGANIIDYGPVDAEGLRKKMTVNMGDGMHLITFTGHCSTGGRCLVPKTAIVNSVCCTKNDADRGHTEFWASGKEYRMKYNMVQRQFFLTHHIKVKTKLKKHKKIVGIWYWKGKKADEIEASFDGDIFMNGNPCKCDIKTTVSQSEINFGKSKAKFYYQVGAEYRSRKESLISTHRVVKDGQSVTAHCKLGKDCNE